MGLDDAAAAHAGLGGDDDVVFDAAVVADVDHVVELDAVAQFGDAEGGTVDGGVGPDFAVVAELDGADLRELLVGAVDFDEAEAVGSEDDAGVEDGAGADGDAIVDGDAGVEEAVGADDGVVPDGAAGADGGVGADDGAFADDGVGADVDVFAELGGAGDGGGGVDAGGVFFGRVEQRERHGEGRARVLDADEGAAGGEGIIDDEAAGLGLGGEGGAFAAGGEGEAGRGGGFDGLGGGDIEVAVAFEGGVETGGEVGDAHSLYDTRVIFPLGVYSCFQLVALVRTWFARSRSVF